MPVISGVSALVIALYRTAALYRSPGQSASETNRPSLSVVKESRGLPISMPIIDFSLTNGRDHQITTWA